MEAITLVTSEPI